VATDRLTEALDIFSEAVELYTQLETLGCGFAKDVADVAERAARDRIRAGAIRAVRTAVELGRDGSRTTFHRRGGMAWTHPPGERYRYWTRIRGGEWGWVEVSIDCLLRASFYDLRASLDAG
jgi:hypothetical protein